MPSDRQRFLHHLAAFGAFLRRVARADSDDLTTSTPSLVSQDEKKRAPRSVQNALCQFRSCQAANVEIFDDDGLVRISVAFRDLKVKVFSLALDLQVRLCRVARHLAPAMAALLAGAQSALLAAQGRLTRPKEARVRGRVPIAIGQKDLQAYVDTDRRSIINRVRQITPSGQLTYDQRVPVTIRTLDQITGLGRADHRGGA
jgi:hypothetical protein